jgi:hypothetical protein
MAGTLLAQWGAVRVEKAQLIQIEAPHPSKSWRPIPYGALANSKGAVLSSKKFFPRLPIVTVT